MRGRSYALAIVCMWAAATLSAKAVAQLPAVAPAPVTRSIADAIVHRDADRVVRISGRAVVGAGKLQASSFDVAIDDGTAGIRLFSRTLQANVREGDSVVATGVVTMYRGNLELAADAVQVIPGSRREIPPHPLAIDPLSLAQHGGQLVQVHGRVAGIGHSEGGQWLRLRDASSTGRGSLTIWIPANHGAPIDLSAVRNQDSLVVTGIVTSYQDNTGDAVIWQIIPRDAADVYVGAVPRNIPEWVLC